MAGFWDEDWGGKHFEAVHIKRVYGISKEKSPSWRSGEEVALWLESEQSFSYVLMEPADVFAAGWVKVLRSWTDIEGNADDPTFHVVDLNLPRAHWWKAAGDKAWEWLISEKQRKEGIEHDAQDVEIEEDEDGSEDEGEKKRKRTERKGKEKERRRKKGEGKLVRMWKGKQKEKGMEKSSGGGNPVVEARRSGGSRYNGGAGATGRSKKHKRGSDVVSSPRPSASTKSSTQPWYSITDSDHEYLESQRHEHGDDWFGASSSRTPPHKLPSSSLSGVPTLEGRARKDGTEIETERSPPDSVAPVAGTRLKHSGHKSLLLSKESAKRCDPQGGASSGPVTLHTLSARIIARREGVDNDHVSSSSLGHELRESKAPPQGSRSTRRSPVAAHLVASREELESSGAARLAGKIQDVHIGPESEPRHVSGMIALTDLAMSKGERANLAPSLTQTLTAQRTVASVASAPRGEVAALSTIAERDEAVAPTTGCNQASIPLPACSRPPPPPPLPRAAPRSGHTVLAIGATGSGLSDLDGRSSKRHVHSRSTT
ncbi:hypothetical protein FRC06_007754 [Ceratobasidium sp. 370]|nr:hypothetical protein FRC06_007754 [Ceratobasidium sp. 370]